MRSRNKCDKVATFANTKFVQWTLDIVNHQVRGENFARSGETWVVKKVGSCKIEVHCIAFRLHRESTWALFVFSREGQRPITTR